MDNNDSIAKNLKGIYKSNFVLAIVVCAIFAGIVFMFYSMNYSATKTNIIKNGEVTAQKTANSIEMVLSGNMDSVKLVAYALDEMITKGRSEEEIQDFLERQSVAKKYALDPDSTGFYAYIYGRFFSGTGWQAPDDYDATIRPWYTKPFEQIGEVTVLDPYLDMQTGKRKLALGKVLCDNVSVVSMDLPTTEIQQMVTSSVNSGDADIGILISADNIVIAHSDTSEVGRDYDIEVDSLGAMIAQNLQDDDDYYFEFDFGGSSYIVYVANITGGLRCISVKNTTNAFKPLRRILFFTVLVLILGIVITLYIVNRTNKLLYLSSNAWKSADDLLDNHISEWNNINLNANKKISNVQLSTRIMWLVLTVLLVSESLVCAAAVFQARASIKASVRQRMIDIANCAAWSVDGDILKNLTAQDIGTPEYQQVYDALAVFRDNIELRYVYGIKDEGDGRFTFTVDPAFGDPAEFGEELVVTEGLVMASQGIPSVDLQKYTDKWGTFYSAYSPVLDSDGNLAGIIGADFGEEWFEDQINNQTDEIVKLYIIVLLITMAFTWVLCYFWVKSVTDPLKYMTKVAVRYGEGDFSEKIAIDSHDEIGVLSRTLQKMSSSLEEQINKAEEANRAKTVFLANMSHEIRTPINTVLGMNEMILRESNERDILYYAEKVKIAGKTLLSLVNDILDFSRIESGKTEIIPSEYSLPSVLTELVNMVETRADEKGLFVNISFDKELPRILLGDEIRIKQVITNLLTNAVKYTTEGSVTFNVTFEKKEVALESIILKVSVADTGIGIHKEDMEKLFAQFERLDQRKNRNIEGAGLGLNITQSLLGLMGSTLQVESEYGKGSVFFFDLEQKVVSWEPMGSYEDISKELSGAAAQKEYYIAPDARVLAVDDNEINLMVLSNLIKRTEVQLDTAESADACISLLTEKKYDLVFLDHMMPQKDGIEILHEIKEIKDGPNQATPIICLTANAILGAKDYYINEGFDAYLTKPIDPAMLEEMILRFLPKDKVIQMTREDVDKNKGKSDDDAELLVPIYERGDIDVDKGIQNNGSIRSYLSILDMFLVHIDDSAREIDALYQEKDIKNYTIKVHAVKSTARMVGAINLGEEAQELENAGKQNDFKYISQHHESFIENYKSFRNLKNKISEQTIQVHEAAGKKPVADAGVMNKMFQDLKAAADNLDTVRIEEIFDEMAAYKIPDSDVELFNKIKEAADGFEYSSIVELIQDEL